MRTYTLDQAPTLPNNQEKSFTSRVNDENITHIESLSRSKSIHSDENDIQVGKSNKKQQKGMRNDSIDIGATMNMEGQGQNTQAPAVSYRGSQQHADDDEGFSYQNLMSNNYEQTLSENKDSQIGLSMQHGQYDYKSNNPLTKVVKKKATKDKDFHSSLVKSKGKQGADSEQTKAKIIQFNKNMSGGLLGTAGDSSKGISQLQSFGINSNLQGLMGKDHIQSNTQQYDEDNIDERSQTKIIRWNDNETRQSKDITESDHHQLNKTHAAFQMMTTPAQIKTRAQTRGNPGFGGRLMTRGNDWINQEQKFQEMYSQKNLISNTVYSKQETSRADKFKLRADIQIDKIKNVNNNMNDDSPFDSLQLQELEEMSNLQNHRHTKKNSQILTSTIKKKESSNTFFVTHRNLNKKVTNDISKNENTAMSQLSLIFNDEKQEVNPRNVVLVSKNNQDESNPDVQSGILEVSEFDTNIASKLQNNINDYTLINQKGCQVQNDESMLPDELQDLHESQQRAIKIGRLETNFKSKGFPGEINIHIGNSSPKNLNGISNTEFIPGTQNMNYQNQEFNGQKIIRKKSQLFSSDQSIYLNSHVEGKLPSLKERVPISSFYVRKQLINRKLLSKKGKGSLQDASKIVQTTTQFPGAAARNKTGGGHQFRRHLLNQQGSASQEKIVKVVKSGQYDYGKEHQNNLHAQTARNSMCLYSKGNKSTFEDDQQTSTAQNPPKTATQTHRTRAKPKTSFVSPTLSPQKETGISGDGTSSIKSTVQQMDQNNQKSYRNKVNTMLSMNQNNKILRNIKKQQNDHQNSIHVCIDGLGNQNCNIENPMKQLQKKKQVKASLLSLELNETAPGPLKTTRIPLNTSQQRSDIHIDGYRNQLHIQNFELMPQTTAKNNRNNPLILSQPVIDLHSKQRNLNQITARTGSQSIVSSSGKQNSQQLGSNVRNLTNQSKEPKKNTKDFMNQKCFFNNTKQGISPQTIKQKNLNWINQKSQKQQPRSILRGQVELSNSGVNTQSRGLMTSELPFICKNIGIQQKQQETTAYISKKMSNVLNSRPTSVQDLDALDGLPEAKDQEPVSKDQGEQTSINEMQGLSIFEIEVAEPSQEKKNVSVPTNKSTIIENNCGIDSWQQSTLPPVSNCTDNLKELNKQQQHKYKLEEQIKILDLPKHAVDLTQKQQLKQLELQSKAKSSALPYERIMLKNAVNEQAGWKYQLRDNEVNRVAVQIKDHFAEEDDGNSCVTDLVSVRPHHFDESQQHFGIESHQKQLGLQMKPLLKDQTNNLYLPNNGYDDYFLYIEQQAANGAVNSRQDKNKETQRDIAMAQIQKRRRDFLIQERRQNLLNQVQNALDSAKNQCAISSSYYQMIAKNQATAADDALDQLLSSEHNIAERPSQDVQETLRGTQKFQSTQNRTDIDNILLGDDDERSKGSKEELKLLLELKNETKTNTKMQANIDEIDTSQGIQNYSFDMSDNQKGQKNESPGAVGDAMQTNSTFLNGQNAVNKKGDQNNCQRSPNVTHLKTKAPRKQMIGQIICDNKDIDRKSILMSSPGKQDIDSSQFKFKDKSSQFSNQSM